MKKYCIIPARMASSRLPGKPLLPILGLELILHVLRRCLAYEGFDRVVVATCDREIFDLVMAEGQTAVMTAKTHERCTDRTAEAVRKLGFDKNPDDFIVMVQGDEIMVAPTMLERLADAYETSRPSAINLISPIINADDYQSPDVVKAVRAPSGKALYLSRSPIPSQTRAPIPSQTRGNRQPVYQQTGVIGFSVECLLGFETLTPTPLENAESIDMLRLLEHGIPLQMVTTDAQTLGVDTPADVERAISLLTGDAFTQSYLEKR